MPSTNSRVLGAGYESDPIRDYAESFNRTVCNIVTEGSYDYYGETGMALKDTSTQESLRKFFVENSYDPEGMKPYEIEAFKENMNQLFDNDIQAMKESCNIASFNALVGMSLPMHKNIMMNMVWDKGGIPKKAAPSMRFNRTMEIRKLVTPDGEEIDMFLEQNKMTKAMRSTNPWVEVELQCGEVGETEIVSAHLNGSEAIDHIDIESHISAVKIKDVYYEEGDVLPDENGYIPVVGGKVATAETKGKHDTWFKINLVFGPGLGEVKRQLMRPVRFFVKMDKSSGQDGSDIQQVKIDDIISANLTKDRFMIQSMKGQVAAVKVKCKLDASARTIDVCTTKWDEITDIVEIGTDEGIATTISPEEIKDVQVLYNINQLTKIMSLMKTAMSNRKDDMIKEYMDDSYDTLAGTNAAFYGVFDYAPRKGYVLDHVEWRQKTFWDYFDTQITQMLRVLNDPNMTVSVFGEPDIIRKITPKQYTYQAPSNIGPVELDFSKTVVTSDKRIYNFIGSDKLRNDYTMIVVLCPRNSMRITYVIYDYQFYISNEIRNNSNPALPQILAFERWKVDQYQPVQGRIKIVNPSGLRADETQTTVW